MESGSDKGTGGFSAMDDYETLISTTDADLLKRSWRNEKAAPEILQFESSLIERSRAQIQLMVRISNKHYCLSHVLNFALSPNWRRCM